jgi:hypothetical protein
MEIRRQLLQGRPPPGNGGRATEAGACRHPPSMHRIQVLAGLLGGGRRREEEKWARICGEEGT